jgi:esterase/lipase superfamily enzyme
MSKESSTWYSERLHTSVKVVRWGHVGTPVLLFPTAAGDAEECERFLMLDVLAPLLAESRIKVYSLDSIAGQALLDADSTPTSAARVQNAFHEFVRHEVVPAIRTDCRSDSLEVVATGASIGAFNALAMLCRYPDVFRSAICMSGTYDITKFMNGECPREHYHSSPLHFLPNLSEGEHLNKLRTRFVLLTHGQGRWEDPQQSWRMADVLGKKGVPNRVDAWGKEWDHDWPTWRRMLPQYLGEMA